MCVCDFDVHFGEHLVTHWVFIKIRGEIFINFTIYVNTFVDNTEDALVFQHTLITPKLVNTGGIEMEAGS